MRKPWNLGLTLIMNTIEGSDKSSGASDVGFEVKLARPRLEKPKLYHVIMLNDDYTPMEFVIEVLELLFFMSTEKATQVMLDVHNKGKAICGVYTHDIAETKMLQVNEYAKENEHPLQCNIKAIE